MTQPRLFTSDEWKSITSSGTERDESNIAKACVVDESTETFEADSLKKLMEARSLDGPVPERAIVWTISTEDRDRDRDRIKQAGWDLKNYKKNPVVLYAHDYRSLPIGRSLDVWVEESAKGPRLKALKQFTAQDENPMGHMIYKLAANKYLKTASVGFRPLVFKEDPEATEKDIEGAVFMPMLFEKTELLESSVVPVPSNPNALHEARSVSGIDLSPYVEWCERVLDECKGAGLWIPRGKVEELWKTVTPTHTIVFGPVQPTKGVELAEEPMLPAIEAEVPIIETQSEVEPEDDSVFELDEDEDLIEIDEKDLMDVVAELFGPRKE